MKTLKNLSLLVLLMMATFGLRAQNGNAVVSEVKAYDMGNGTAILKIRVSGNQAYKYTGGSFSVSGDRVPGGSAGGGIGIDSRVAVQAPAPGNGNGNTNPNGNQPVILTAMFPFAPSSENGPGFVSVSYSVSGWGTTAVVGSIGGMAVVGMP